MKTGTLALLSITFFLSPFAIASAASAKRSAAAEACFTRAFCSTGEAPKYILCSRGQDCTKAKDLGLRFKTDCSVGRWLGDAQQVNPYAVNDNNTITVVLSPTEIEVYEISRDGQTLTLKSNPKWVYASVDCPQNDE